MKSVKNRIVAAFLLFSFFSACKSPPVPPEVKEAETQDLNLWRAGAAVYVPEEYELYKSVYREAREQLNEEKAKFVWFRKYSSIVPAFKGVLEEGQKVMEKLEEQKQSKAAMISGQMAVLKGKIAAFQSITLVMDEGKFIRSLLTPGELKLMEAELLYQRENYLRADEKLEEAALNLKETEDLVLSTLERYNDEAMISKWKNWVRDTLAESMRRRIVVIIVSKIDQKLFLYRNGKLLRTYKIGLGRNGLFHKLRAGDYATPEGKYRVVKKLSSSRYHRALLIDYPSDEDRARFDQGRKDGLIPEEMGVGGLIEIHGGGKDVLTDGCISLEDEDIGELFGLVEVGTPVTIVGGLQSLSEILSSAR